MLVKVEDGIHLKVKIAAAEMRITMSDFVVGAILEKLLRDEDKIQK